MLNANAYINVTLSPVDWHLRQQKLEVSDLEKLLRKMEAYQEKLDDHHRYVVKAMDDESLPDRIYWQMDKVDIAMEKMADYLSDGIDAVRESIKSLNSLEDNLNFIFRDVASIVKGI